MCHTAVSRFWLRVSNAIPVVTERVPQLTSLSIAASDRANQALFICHLLAAAG